jgi:hypothetical protein
MFRKRKPVFWSDIICIIKIQVENGKEKNFYFQTIFFHCQTSSASCSSSPLLEVGSQLPYGVSSVAIHSSSSTHPIPTGKSAEEQRMRKPSILTFGARGGQLFSSAGHIASLFVACGPDVSQSVMLKNCPSWAGCGPRVVCCPHLVYTEQHFPAIFLRSSQLWKINMVIYPWASNTPSWCAKICMFFDKKNH